LYDTDIVKRILMQYFCEYITNLIASIFYGAFGLLEQ